jgi:hypothetical protein
MQPVFLANCHEERFGFDPWIQSIRFHSAVQEQKQWNVELSIPRCVISADSSGLHESPSAVLFRDCLLPWIGILGHDISGLSLLSCSSSTRQSLAVSSKSDSFLSSMHFPRVSHSAISTETSVRVGAIKWCPSSGCRSLNLWLAESNPHCNQLDDQMFHRLVWFVTGGSWVRNHGISKGSKVKGPLWTICASVVLLLVFYMQIWRILKCLSSLDLPWQLLQGVSRWSVRLQPCKSESKNR